MLVVAHRGVERRPAAEPRELDGRDRPAARGQLERLARPEDLTRDGSAGVTANWIDSMWPTTPTRGRAGHSWRAAPLCCSQRRSSR